MPETTEKRGPYQRRTYDPDRHCGVPVDRSRERYEGDLQKAKAILEELATLATERELTFPEEARRKRKVRKVAYTQQKLDLLERDGPDDRPCMYVKGHGTEHSGVGLCVRHCKCRGRMVRGCEFAGEGRRSVKSRMKDKKLRDVMDAIEQSDQDLLNLEPYVLMLQAKIEIFCEEKPDTGPDSIKSFTLLTEQLRKMIESINDKKFKAMIGIDMFHLIMERMGQVVARYVDDPDIVDKIASAWQAISVDALEKKNRALLTGAVARGRE